MAIVEPIRLRRHTRRNPCPVCGGGDDDPRGRGVRCDGFTSGDGRYAHCSREEYAGALEPERNGRTYAHRLDGPCACGEPHRGTEHATASDNTFNSRKRASGSPTTWRYERIPEAVTVRDQLWHQVAIYPYPHAAGEPHAHEVRRYEPPDGGDKTFRPYSLQADGLWRPSKEGITPWPLYNLPALSAAPADTLILWPEGEKCANTTQAALRAASLPWVVTTTPGGEAQIASLPQTMFAPLAGRVVVIIGDRDPLDKRGERPGERYAAAALKHALAAGAERAIILWLDELAEHEDVYDWLAAGHDGRELAARVNAALATPAEPSEPAEPTPTAELAAWPTLDPAAWHGLAGAIVRLIEPHTEADPVAILAQILTYFGNAVGRTAYVPVEAQRHYANENVVLVGDTAKARKGTSAGWVDSVYTSPDGELEEWRTRHLLSGLTSGEGLIHAVRDRAEDDDATPTTALQNALQNDKRLLILESEFGATLRIMGRDGNSLSGIVREAWDGRTLRTMGKRAPEVATDAHISIVGHVTRDELLRYLSATDSTNGFGNRFLWVCVRRSKSLPEGGSLSDEALDSYREKLARAVKAARGDGTGVYPMRRDDEARQLWCEVYEDLSAGASGLFGAMTARSEAHVMRLALLYALLDQARVIRRPHLEAALALWRYCEDSARYLFGDRLTDPTAEAILRGLLDAGDAGLTRTQISQLLGGHAKADEIARALDLLRNLGRARCKREATSGRAIERWYAARIAKEAKEAKEARADNLQSSHISHISQFAEFAAPPIDAQPPIPAYQNEWASMGDGGIYGEAGDAVSPSCERPANCARRTLATGRTVCGLCDARHPSPSQPSSPVAAARSAQATTQHWS